ALWLALTVLNKRALSSAKALQYTVERRLAASAQDGSDAAHQLTLFDADEDVDAADRPPELAGLRLGDPRREHAWLETLASAARDAARHETKIARLIRLLDAIREPAVVFTEYRDTLVHIQRRLGTSAAILHGALSRAERSAALDDFTNGRRRVLLATDAAGEG